MVSRSESPVDPPSLVVVVDTSVLISIKTRVPLDAQWELLRIMEDLVKVGRLAFPKQVWREMRDGKHPDAPDVWTAAVKAHIRHADPELETLAKVLAVAPGMVDVDAGTDMEKADSYVAAMAVELSEWDDECRIIVAANDVIDRPPLISLATACRSLGIDCWATEDFIHWCRTDQTPEDVAAAEAAS